MNIAIGRVHPFLDPGEEPFGPWVIGEDGIRDCLFRYRAWITLNRNQIISIGDDKPVRVVIFGDGFGRLPGDAGNGKAKADAKDTVARFPQNLKTAKQISMLFRDEADIQAGENYERIIEQRRKDLTKLVVVCSPDARKSKYVEDEIRRMMSRT